MEIEMNIKNLNGVKWKYKDAIYTSIALGQMKHPETREWVAAVIYGRIDKPELGVFMRELKDFESKFVEIEKTKEGTDISDNKKAEQ